MKKNFEFDLHITGGGVCMASMTLILLVCVVGAMAADFSGGAVTWLPAHNAGSYVIPDIC